MKSLGMLIIALALLCTPVLAADWGPFPVKTLVDGKETAVQFTPPASASKAWKLCALVPHVKDSYWLAADYGLVEEAKRLGVAIDIYEAGGYGNLPKQVNQFDNCLAAGADAVLVAPISEAGLTGSFERAKTAGIVTIAFINPVTQSPISGKVFTQMKTKGVQAGKYLVDALGDKQVKVVGFPGAQGSGWAEEAVDGFKEGIAGSKVQLLDVKFGDTGVTEQLGLVEDALQTYPEMNLIWGTAPTVEAAIGAIDEAGRNDISIMAEYGTKEMLDLLRQGKIMGLVSDYTVIQARIAVDLAVLALEKKLTDATQFDVEPSLITDPAAKVEDILQHFAPDDWSPVFTGQ